MYDSSSGSNVKRSLTGIGAGFIFGIAWWVIIDAGAYAATKDFIRKYKFEHMICGIIATFALFMVNSFKWEDYKGEGFSENNHKRAKICLFLGSLILFLCLLGSLWVAIDRWLAYDFAENKWQGIALILNTVLIFISAGVLRAGRAS